MIEFNDFIFEKVITKQIKAVLMKKAKAKSGDVEPCSGKTIDQCIVYQDFNNKFLFFYNDKSGSTRIVMEGK